MVFPPLITTATVSLASGRYRPEASETVAVVISGGNTTAVDFGG